jgi:hypothetical protein
VYQQIPAPGAQLNEGDQAEPFHVCVYVVAVEAVVLIGREPHDTTWVFAIQAEPFHV